MTPILNTVLTFVILFGAVMATMIGGALLTDENDKKKNIVRARLICLILAVSLFYGALARMS